MLEGLSCCFATKPTVPQGMASRNVVSELLTLAFAKETREYKTDQHQLGDLRFW